jgi:hypothetical protein
MPEISSASVQHATFAHDGIYLDSSKPHEPNSPRVQEVNSIDFHVDSIKFLNVMGVRPEVVRGYLSAVAKNKPNQEKIAQKHSKMREHFDDGLHYSIINPMSSELKMRLYKETADLSMLELRSIFKLKLRNIDVSDAFKLQSPNSKMKFPETSKVFLDVKPLRYGKGLVNVTVHTELQVAKPFLAQEGIDEAASSFVSEFIKHIDDQPNPRKIYSLEGPS